MSKLTLVKAAAELVVSVGVGAIVSNTIKTSTPVDTKLIKKVCIGIGGFVLSSMVSDKATKYTTEHIDNASVQIEEVKDLFKSRKTV